MPITFYSSNSIKKLCISVGIVFLLALTFCTSSQAQTWKPLCANGSGAQGAHNGTWQRINSAAAGGGTWKKLGDCNVGYAYTMTTGYEPYGGSIGFRSVSFGGLSPMGAFSSPTLKGATFAEVAQFASAVEVCLIGVYPMNFFNTVSLAGKTYYTNVCTTNVGGACYYVNDFVDNGTVYTCWDFNNTTTGITTGANYQVIFN